MLNTVQCRHYLAQLTRVLGAQSAKLELAWILQSIHHRQPPDRHLALSSMVARRVSGEPLQYILGTQPFGSLQLLTRPPVLIPRPETEDWTIRLSEYVKPTLEAPIKLLDLCTGSGCIPLLLCKLWPAGTVRTTGVDISSDAIQLAEDNAKHCGILSTSDVTPSATASAHNTFNAVLADMRDPVFVSTMKSSGEFSPFHVITSNPPYIPKDEYEQLPPSVKDYEDIRALLGDPDMYPNDADISHLSPTPRSDVGRGLSFYHDIARLAHKQQGLLAEDGVVAVEVGKGQADDVTAIFKEEGNLQHTAIWKDPWDVERVVVASPTRNVRLGL
ncbi:S-adenosyl-L-methionine-dependent methyltransferase [Cytidiella melzeri]|nr:S-adenosyl-L-methionine-dependent methyltransferase [Cytidiella melzeri]